MVPPNNIEFSLLSITCQEMTNDILFLPPSLEPVVINCTVEIRDDSIGLEDDEVYELNIDLVEPAPDTVPVTPGITMIRLAITDDDG